MAFYCRFADWQVSLPAFWWPRARLSRSVSSASFCNTVKVHLKRLPAQPREARFVSAKKNAPTTIAPIPFDTMV
ncbi:MAG: hypothetical protein BJ554DRAFT_8171 [Olpidium bornovanus]|uniref:Uncharacterized protein n=1 Tax=Olpidium bornovanus TaxID=278681 RepID=A0A8H7ZVD6_9FUNG|nr:MAG: hypothetical protein BJ554DRAFT_8171 [Olpidium bornovanus]